MDNNVLNQNNKEIKSDITNKKFNHNYLDFKNIKHKTNLSKSP